MSMGHFEQDNPRLSTRNEMQFALAEMHGEDFMDFVNKHAKTFGDYFDKHPELVARYKDNPEEALKEKEKIVYH
jgi:hypothetical protein